MISPAVLFPFAAAIIYALAALFLNAAGRAGFSGRVSTAWCNFFLALFFLGFYDGSNFPAIGSPVWPIVLLAVFFVLGQFFTILAFSLGEVSVVTPVMGLKVVLVNFMVALGLREPLGARIWIAAGLSVLGIAILQSNPKRLAVIPHKFSSIFCAFLSALFFAGVDVMIQHWSPILGFNLFLPPAMLLTFLLSVLFLAPIGKPARPLPPRSVLVKNLLPGSMLLGLQSTLLAFAIGRHGNVAQANIIYSSRGVWGVVFVWLIGHLFANTEFGKRDTSRLIRRLLGAILITVAIAMSVL